MYILLYEVFLTFAVEANQKYSTDNSKDSSFFEYQLDRMNE